MTEKQADVLCEAREWFGELNEEQEKSAKKIALWLMGRKQGVKLTEAEKDIVFFIQENRKAETLLENAF